MSRTNDIALTELCTDPSSFDISGRRESDVSERTVPGSDGAAQDDVILGLLVSDDQALVGSELWLRLRLLEAGLFAKMAGFQAGFQAGFGFQAFKSCRFRPRLRLS